MKWKECANQGNLPSLPTSETNNALTTCMKCNFVIDGLRYSNVVRGSIESVESERDLYQRLFPPRGAELEEVKPPIYQRPC